MRNVEPNSVQIDAVMKTDSVFQMTSWIPLSKSGTRDNTSRRLIIDNNTASFNTPLISVLSSVITICFAFAVIICLVSLMTLQIIQLSHITLATRQVAAMYGVAALTVISIAYGIIKKYINNSIIPIRFDKKTKCFQRGFSKKVDNINPRQQGVIKSSFFDNISLNMDNIYALQIISETVSHIIEDINTTKMHKHYYKKKDINTTKMHKHYYKKYELNAVLKDGSRVNILDHGEINILNNNKIKQLMEDIQKLSQFLGKPLWSAA